MTPGLITAPGYSRDPVVASVMAAKCLKINGLFTCECIADLDSTEDGLNVYGRLQGVYLVAFFGDCVLMFLRVKDVNKRNRRNCKLFKSRAYALV